MPLLAFFIPLPVAAPLAVLVSITIAAVVVAQDWRHIHLRSAAGLVLATLAGIPLGLLVLTSHHQQAVKAGLGILIAAFAVYALLGRNAMRLKHDSRPVLIACGFVAGVLGGAYGMNGPPLVVYGSLRRWSPQQFRATLQAYFLPASLLGMAGYWAAGLWTRTVSTDYVLCLPVILPAIFLGRAINRRFSGNAFLKYVYSGLVLIGALLFVQALTHRA